MFREYVKDCRDRKTVVKVFLTNGGCIQGRIEQIGPEAFVLVNDKGKRVLVMKSGVISIAPGDGKEGRKDG